MAVFFVGFYMFNFVYLKQLFIPGCVWGFIFVVSIFNFRNC